MGKIKVLMFDRTDSVIFPGGDTNQIKAIHDFLSRNGFETQILNSIPDKPVFGDVALLFNLTRPCDLVLQAMFLKQNNVPYIIFPVYWNIDKVIPYNHLQGFDRYLKALLPLRFIDILRVIRNYKRDISQFKQFNLPLLKLVNSKKMMTLLLNNAAKLCPNSTAEAEHLVSEFCLEDSNKIQIILNGVNIPPEINVLNKLDIEYLKTKKYICCVGGIGPRKNQLNLVKAANLTGCDIVIVGQSSARDKAYFDKIKSLALTNIHFTGQLSSSDVLWLMKHSVGHIQPSFIETPGIASLEAAILGKPIGVSNVKPVKEYFNKMAYYCDPYSIDSIAKCLDQIMQNDKGADTVLSEFIKNNYLWDIVLNPLLELIYVVVHKKEQIEL